MSEWHQLDGLSWRLLNPFGVEVDADLSTPLSAAAGERLASVFWQHSLLVAHNQNLSMERQRALSGLLGPILIREGENGYLSNEGEHMAVKSGLSFHADAAYTEHPFDAIALHAMDVVDGASSTRFVNAEQAYRELPAALRKKISGRESRMITPGFGILTQRVCDIREPDFMLEGVRPTVVLNPNTGNNYLNMSEMHTAQLLGLAWEESRDIVNQAFDILYAPENSYEHIWHQGDLIIWDNQALQHARGSLDGVGKRVLQRVIVGTEGVAPHAAVK